MVHESRVSIETLRFCRKLVGERLEQAEGDLMHPASENHRGICEHAVSLLRFRCAELGAEIAAKEAEGNGP